MAYVFKVADDFMQGNGSNIFDQKGEENTPASPLNFDATKTTVEGPTGISGAAANSEASGSPQSDSSLSSSAAQNNKARVFEVNRGKTQAPAGVDNLSVKLSENIKRAQDRADDYLKQSKKSYDEDYRVSNRNLDKALAGDSEAYDRVGRILDTKAVKGPEAKYDSKDLYVSGIDNLSSDAGLRKMASQGQGRRYSDGMAAFDAMLMGQDKDFRDRVAGINRQNREHEQFLRERPDELERQARDYGQSVLSSEQWRVRGNLENLMNQDIAKNEQEAKAYNAMLAGLDREAIADYERAEATRRAAAAAKSQYGDRISDEIAGLDPYNLSAEDIRFDEGGYSYRDFIDSQEAERLNRILSLKGGGDLYQGAAGPRAERYSLDRGAIQDAIYSNISQAVEADDQASRRQMQDILASARARASEANQRAVDGRAGWIQARDEYAGDLRGRENYDKVARNYALDPVAEVDLYDMLSADDAKALNRANLDLGYQGDQYSSGSFSPGAYNFDVADFEAYLQGELGKLAPSAPVMAPEPNAAINHSNNLAESLVPEPLTHKKLEKHGKSILDSFTTAPTINPDIYNVSKLGKSLVDSFGKVPNANNLSKTFSKALGF